MKLISDDYTIFNEESLRLGQTKTGALNSGLTEKYY
jgi:hypothetical protein